MIFYKNFQHLSRFTYFPPSVFDSFIYISICVKRGLRFLKVILKVLKLSKYFLLKLSKFKSSSNLTKTLLFFSYSYLSLEPHFMVLLLLLYSLNKETYFVYLFIYISLSLRIKMTC